MKIGILSVGNELLSGRTRDGNLQFFREKCHKWGHHLELGLTAPDSVDVIASMLDLLGSHCRLAVVSGGLGPTRDDLTREAVARWWGQPLLLHTQAWEWLTEFLDKKGRPADEVQKRQALLPKGADPVRNHVGTACGFTLKKRAFRLFVLPGVPREFQFLVARAVEPELQRHGRQTLERHLWTWGWPEAEQERVLGNLGLPREFAYSSLPSAGGVRIGLLARQPSAARRLKVPRAKAGSDARHRFRKMWREILKRIPPEVRVRPLGRDIPSAMVHSLLRARARVCLAESCTGGSVAALVTSVPGSSRVFERGIVTYSNREKTRLLGVPEDQLQEHGAVSEPVVRAMAAGALEAGAGEYALAVSGIAGPGGGTRQKPVGTVWVAGGRRGYILTRRLHLAGDRGEIRLRAAYAALWLLLEILQKK